MKNRRYETSMFLGGEAAKESRGLRKKRRTGRRKESKKEEKNTKKRRLGVLAEGVCTF